MFNLKFSKWGFWALVMGYVAAYFFLNLSQWGSRLAIWDIDIIALVSFCLFALGLIVLPILTMALLLPQHRFAKPEEKFLRLVGIGLGSIFLYGTVCKFVFVLVLFNSHF